MRDVNVGEYKPGYNISISKTLTGKDGKVASQAIKKSLFNWFTLSGSVPYALDQQIKNASDDHIQVCGAILECDQAKLRVVSYQSASSDESVKIAELKVRAEGTKVAKMTMVFEGNYRDEKSQNQQAGRVLVTSKSADEVDALYSKGRSLSHTTNKPQMHLIGKKAGNVADLAKTLGSKIGSKRPGTPESGYDSDSSVESLPRFSH